MQGGDESGSSFHDPTLFAKPGTILAALVEQVASVVEQRIGITGSRASPRGAVARRRQAIDNLLANVAGFALAANHAAGQRLAIATAKTKPTRYDRSIVNRRVIAPMLHALEAAGLIVVHPAVFKQRITTIEPSEVFYKALRDADVSLKDLRRDGLGEAIVLSARSQREGRFGEPAPKDRIDYEDNDRSVKYREEMERINVFLNAATLEFDGVVQAPVALRRTFLLRAPDDPVSFDLNGRLVGGWWLSLPSSERYRITLNGEQLADLDFRGMFIQLAYRLGGDVLSEQFDPYAVPGLEKYRDGAKKAVLSLLGRVGVMRKLSSELKAQLPEGWTASRVVAAVSELHPDIAHLFGKDIGVELMFLESQILVALLLRLAAAEIAALPMHDGIMVARSNRDAARKIMAEVSAELLGGPPLPVTEKSITRPPHLNRPLLL